MRSGRGRERERLIAPGGGVTGGPARYMGRNSKKAAREKHEGVRVRAAGARRYVTGAVACFSCVRVCVFDRVAGVGEGGWRTSSSPLCR